MIDTVYEVGAVAAPMNDCTDRGPIQHSRKRPMGLDDGTGWDETGWDGGQSVVTETNGVAKIQTKQTNRGLFVCER